MTDVMPSKEAIQMMERCRDEIRSLRAQIDRLRPKADAYDNLAIVLGLLPRASMGTKERDKLLSFLFDRDDCQLVNIKFFRGPKRATSEDICREAHMALSEALKSPKHVVPVSGIKKISRTDLVRAI